MYEVLIIGGGPAGLSAALTLGRARRRVAVVDAGEPRNAPAEAGYGFLTRDGIAPAELLARGRAEVRGYGVELVDDRVDTVLPGFRVGLASGRELRADQLLVTTGLRDVLPDLPGVAELWGGDVHACPYCHGWEVRDRPIGVLAAGPAGEAKANLLRQWSDDVVLFDPDEVARLVVADGRLTGVERLDGTVVPRAALFVTPTMVPSDTLLRDLGCALDERGFVQVDGAGRTSVPGVWAAGNVVDTHAQLIIAAGAGARTAMTMNNHLVLADPPLVPAGASSS